MVAACCSYSTRSKETTSNPRLVSSLQPTMRPLPLQHLLLVVEAAMEGALRQPAPLPLQQVPPMTACFALQVFWLLKRVFGSVMMLQLA